MDNEIDEYVHVMEVEKFYVVDSKYSSEYECGEIVLDLLNEKIGHIDEDLDGRVLEIRDATITGIGSYVSDDDTVQKLVKVQALFYVSKPYGREGAKNYETCKAECDAIDGDEGDEIDGGENDEMDGVESDESYEGEGGDDIDESESDESCEDECDASDETDESDECSPCSSPVPMQEREDSGIAIEA